MIGIFKWNLPSEQVDGLIVWVETYTEIRAWLEESAGAQNLVVLGQKVPGCDSIDASLVTGTRDALTHLFEQGYRRIAYLAPASSLTSSADPRPLVYRQFMQEVARPVRIVWYEGVSHSPEAACRHAEEIASLPPDERPDALFCFNDLTAMGALLGVRRVGLEPPRDIAIVGCDGLPLAAQLDVPITSIVYPLEEMCREAVAMLRSRLETSADPAHTPLAVRVSSKRVADNPN